LLKLFKGISINNNFKYYIFKDIIIEADLNIINKNFNIYLNYDSNNNIKIEFILD